MITNRSTARLGRRLIAIDIENVVGGACLARDQVEGARGTISDVIGFRVPDQIVIGTSHIGLIEVGTGWPRVRYVVHSGPDGADRALLDVLTEDIARGFGQVVLVSGDGVFAESIAVLAAQGVHCTVVSHEDRLSRRLRLAAAEVHHIPYPSPIFPSGSAEFVSRMIA